MSSQIPRTWINIPWKIDSSLIHTEVITHFIHDNSLLLCLLLIRWSRIGHCCLNERVYYFVPIFWIVWLPRRGAWRQGRRRNPRGVEAVRRDHDSQEYNIIIILQYFLYLTDLFPRVWSGSSLKRLFHCIVHQFDQFVHVSTTRQIIWKYLKFESILPVCRSHSREGDAQ